MWRSSGWKVRNSDLVSDISVLSSHHLNATQRRYDVVRSGLDLAKLKQTNCLKKESCIGFATFSKVLKPGQNAHIRCERGNCNCAPREGSN